jgi:CRP-like cAMP-binding protein
LDTDPTVSELLKMQKVAKMNPAVSDLSSILPVIMEKKVYPKEGTVLMKTGDKSNGFYFVREGKFECFADDGTVVRELHGGDLFGELGVFFSEPRMLTVKSSSPNASTWFVDEKSYKVISKLNGLEDAESQSILKKQYPDYSDFLKKREALQRLKILRKELTNTEINLVANFLERHTFQTGDDVMLEGSDDTDYMYFVESGNYEVLGVDKVLPNQKVVGELSFFLRRPRSATIRASSSLSMFKLSRDDLLSVVDETRLETESVALLAEQYREAGLVKKYEEVLEYITIKSRPKKELVSSHSILATVASGMFLIGIVPCISPGLNENGAPHIFNLNNFGLGLPETQLMMLLFAIVGSTGSFRLPPNTPLLRRHFFNFTALQTIVNYMLQDSNIVAIEKGSHHTFDLLTVNIGSVLFWAVFAVTNVWTMKLISEAICAPEKARSVVPLNGKIPAININIFVYHKIIFNFDL